MILNKIIIICYKSETKYLIVIYPFCTTFIDIYFSLYLQHVISLRNCHNIKLLLFVTQNPCQKWRKHFNMSKIISI